MGSRIPRENYTVGWVCALSVELAAAQEVLDEEHQGLDDGTNIYRLGRISNHNVVIACLPEGRIGTHSAAIVAVQMKAVFTSIRFCLLVGIGGGVPSGEVDIQLGDVVIGVPYKSYNGVVQYDLGKATQNGFERIGALNAPPAILLNAVTQLRASHIMGRSRLSEFTSKLSSSFARENAGSDILFDAEYKHVGGDTCDQCSKERVVKRKPRRSQEIVIHYGTIASGNQVIKNAVERDRLSSELGGVFCFEMEAAGLMNSLSCLVIRGICDYADSHKNKRWQTYAAGTSAACAKEVLLMIPTSDVAKLRTVHATITSLATLKGHSGWVGSVAFSPDGKLLASGSEDGTVMLWDIAVGLATRVVECHSGWVGSVAFSPSGDLLALGSEDGTVLCDVVTGSVMQRLESNSNAVWSVAFSPDSKLLASGSANGRVMLWDVDAGSAMHALKGHSNCIWSVAFSPDSKRLVSGSADGTVRLWDSSSGSSMQILKGHLGWVGSVAFSPDGKLLASGSADGTVRLWNAPAGSAMQVLKGHLGWIGSVAFSPDGKLLTSGSADGTVRLWDTLTCLVMQELVGHSNCVNSVAFSPDGKLLASGSADGTVMLWDIAAD